MGKIKVTVQTEDRLAAINNLSIAIRDVARALRTGTLVEIISNKIQGDPAVSVDTEEEVAETKIVEND